MLNFFLIFIKNIYMFLIYSYIGGLEEESDYHYKAKDGLCEFNPSLAKATVREVFNITEGDEDQLAIAISYFNPVSIAFEVRFMPNSDQTVMKFLGR